MRKPLHWLVRVATLAFALSGSCAGPSGYVTDIAAGGSHTCALVAGGRVKCWGSNASGEIGDGTRIARTSAVSVIGLPVPVVAISLGESHSCALTTGGEVRCWGSNYNGQLGDGTAMDRSTPVTVAGLSSGVKAIAAGRNHTCALTTGGAMLCWGNNGYGQLGDGTYTGRRIPTPVHNLSREIVSIAAGHANSAAVTALAQVEFWGRDGATLTQGECLPPPPCLPSPWGPCIPAPPYCPTIATPAFSPLPRDGPPLPALPTAVSIAGDDRVNYTRSYNLCTVVADGQLMCWAGNATAQGVGAGIWFSGATTVSMGGDHLCLLGPGGAAQCWGDNMFGQLGDGTTEDRAYSTPAPVAGLPGGLARIAAGFSHTCALTAPGDVMCWGSNAAGQLGDGTRVNRPTPVMARGLTGAEPIPATVYEFYHPSLDHYFITWRPDELAVLDAGSPGNGWIRTGYAFGTFSTPQPGTSAVCRYYIPPALGDSHYFGRSAAECEATGRKFPSFVLEDPAFMQMYLPVSGVCPPDTTPVYRVFSNRADANHRYTVDQGLRDLMVKNGWLAEGDGPDLVTMCAPQ
jgi:hypothetical protein